MKKIKTFYYRMKSKANKDGASPIYAKVIYEGKPTYISSGHFLYDNEWDEKKKQVKPKCSKAYEIRKDLQEIEEKILKIFKDLLAAGHPFGVKKIKEIYESKVSASLSLIDTIQYRVDLLKSLQKSDGTINHYICLKNKIRRFLEYQYHVKDISLDRITYETLLHFESYQKIICKNQRNTVPKNMCRLRTVLALGRKLGWTTNNPFSHYRISYEQPQIKFLMREEVQRIQQLVCSSRSLTYVKDFFLFMTYTGLSHCDVIRLSADHIINQGEKMLISIVRKKTGTRCTILVVQEAKDIIKKYIQSVNSGEMIFKKNSVQHMDRMLKKIAISANVRRNLSCHWGRHTFATLAVENRVPIETVSKSLGHSTIKDTQIYAQITLRKVAIDFDRMENYYFEK